MHIKPCLKFWVRLYSLCQTDNDTKMSMYKWIKNVKYVQMNKVKWVCTNERECKVCTDEKCKNIYKWKII